MATLDVGFTFASIERAEVFRASADGANIGETTYVVSDGTRICVDNVTQDDLIALLVLAKRGNGELTSISL